MIIKTKYNPGQEVYFHFTNQPMKGTIKYVQLRRGTETQDYLYYWINYDREDMCFNEIGLNEDQIFPNKGICILDKQIQDEKINDN